MSLTSGATELATWLRSSIVGIILLGAIGSAVAALVITGGRVLLLKIVPDRYQEFRRSLKRRHYMSGFVMGALAAQFEKDGKIQGYFIYFSFLLGRLVLSLGVATVVAGVLPFLLIGAGVVNLTLGSFIAIVAIFLLLIDAWRTYRVLVTTHQQVLEPLLGHGRRAFTAWDRAPKGELESTVAPPN